MKFTPIFVLLASGAPIIAHAQTANTPAVAALPLAPKSAATSDAFVWRFAPPVGSHWTMRSFKRAVSISPLDENHKSELYKTTATQHFTADYDVLSRDKFGATTIRLTYREMSDYLVTVPIYLKISRSRPSGGAYEKAIDGATLTFKQGPDGRVWSVVGARAFFRRALRARGMTDENAIRATLDSPDFPSNEEIAQSMSRQKSGIPTWPVRVGESWKTLVTFPDMGNVPTPEASGTRTLKSLNTEAASIAENARFDGSDPNQKLPDDGSNVDVNYRHLTGTLNSTERVQRSSGLALETNVTATLKGRIIVRPRTRENDDMSVPAPAQEIPVNVVSTMRSVIQPR